jgi:acyl dehydratase
MSARSLSEVSVGDPVGPVTVPVTREVLKAYADASGDQNPIHQDEEFARSVGLPVEYGTRFTKPVVVPTSGAEVVVDGVVKAVDLDTGRVTVDLTTTSGGQKVLGRCVAVVRLD